MKHGKLKVSEVCDALRRSKGMISVCAESLGVSRVTIYAMRDRHPQVQEVIEAERHKFIDVAELALYNAVIRGEAWAVSLVVKTLGRDRGYVEQFRVDQNQQLALIPSAIQALVGFAPLPDGAIDISPEETSEDVEVEEVKPLTNGNGHKITRNFSEFPDNVNEDKGDGDDWAL
jgi:hypothetical protein